MKIILVTSELTYVPENYNDVFEHVVRNSVRHIAGVVLVNINRPAVLAKLPYLYFARCTNIAHTLTNNLGDTLLRTKEKFLKQFGISYILVKSINDQKTIAWLQAMRPDMIVNMRARCIYNDAVLIIPRLGCVNVHHGILPHQKGIFCDLYALAENKPTGFTIHQMTSRLDQGKIIYQDEVGGNKNYIDYLTKTASKEKKAIVNFIQRTTQNDSLQEATVLQRDQRGSITTTPDFKTIKAMQCKGIIL